MRLLPLLSLSNPFAPSTYIYRIPKTSGLVKASMETRSQSNREMLPFLYTISPQDSIPRARAVSVLPKSL